MNRPGTGVILSQMSGREKDLGAWKSVVNKEISALEMGDIALTLTMTDGTGFNSSTTAKPAANCDT